MISHRQSEQYGENEDARGRASRRRKEWEEGTEGGQRHSRRGTKGRGLAEAIQSGSAHVAGRGRGIGNEMEVMARRRTLMQASALATFDLIISSLSSFSSLAPVLHVLLLLPLIQHILPARHAFPGSLTDPPQICP